LVALLPLAEQAAIAIANSVLAKPDATRFIRCSASPVHRNHEPARGHESFA
jgi:hypothetical protein